jgi:hypothetical protein
MNEDPKPKPWSAWVDAIGEAKVLAYLSATIHEGPETKIVATQSARARWDVFRKVHPTAPEWAFVPLFIRAAWTLSLTYSHLVGKWLDHVAPEPKKGLKKS